MRSLSAMFRRLVIPWGARSNQPRVVIATDDEIGSLFGNAAITHYFGERRAFVAPVSGYDDGSTGYGEYGIYALAYDGPGRFDYRLAQFITMHYGVYSSADDDLSLSVGDMGVDGSLLSMLPGDAELAADGNVTVTAGNQIELSAPRLLIGSLDVMGAWIPYTPVWSAATTNPTYAAGVVTGAYMVIGKTVHFRIGISPNAATTYGAGDYRFTMPFPVVAEQVAAAIFRDNSGATSYSLTAWLQSGTTILYVVNSTGNKVSGTVPVAWAASDRLQISGTYERA